MFVAPPASDGYGGVDLKPLLAETKAVLDLANTARDWLTEIVNKSKDRRRNTAAQTLASASVLLAAMHGLSNGFRGALSELAFPTPSGTFAEIYSASELSENTAVRSGRPAAAFDQALNRGIE
jgi:hypothetical protein